MADLDPEICSCFLDEAKELLESTEQCFLDLENAKNDPAIIDRILRLAHSIKGSAAAVGFESLSRFTHKLESVLLRIKKSECEVQPQMVNLLLQCSDLLKSAIARLRENPLDNIDYDALGGRLEAVLACTWCRDEKAGSPGLAKAGACGWSRGDCKQEGAIVPAAEAEQGPADGGPARVAKAPAPKKAATADDSIRVSLARIDKLMNDVGELVILQTSLSQSRHLLQSATQLATVNQMDKIVREVQELTMGLRMVSLGQTFQKMQRIVRDTSQALSKDVALEVSGEEIELDKGVLEQLGDPLVHLLRNAVDHGLESTEERRAAGKPPRGRVTLKAYHSGGRVVIEIRDDGKGLDPKKLVAKAIEKGLLPADAALEPRQAYQLIFAPGFSTKEQVTATSGRGVGMDVVKTNITALQGEIAIETALGRGTTFLISLPLTLAIVEALVVRIGGERYSLPIVQVSETVQIEPSQISTLGETGRVLRLRDENIPMHGLDQILGERSTSRTAAVGIIIRDNLQAPRCILVDQIIGQQQVVIKRLGGEIDWLAGVMGAAILGDGEAVLILDIQELLRSRAQRPQKLNGNSLQQINQTREAV